MTSEPTLREAMEALRPFAEDAERFAGKRLWPDETDLSIHTYGRGITVGDLRRAATAYEALSRASTEAAGNYKAQAARANAAADVVVGQDTLSSFRNNEDIVMTQPFYVRPLELIADPHNPNEKVWRDCQREHATHLGINTDPSIVDELICAAPVSEAEHIEEAVERLNLWATLKPLAAAPKEGE